MTFWGVLITIYIVINGALTIAATYYFIHEGYIRKSWKKICFVIGMMFFGLPVCLIGALSFYSDKRGKDEN